LQNVLLPGTQWSFQSRALYQSCCPADGVEIGRAVDLKKNKAVDCYEQTCKGFNLDASVGIAVNYGWFRSLEDIPGKATVVFGDVEIPNTETGVSFASVINSDNEYIGTLGTLGTQGLCVGLSPLPFDVGGASCNTPKHRIIEFKVSI
jgi:hypothetical protein